MGKEVDLEAGLNDPANRDEAGGALRGLIETIELTLDAQAKGDLSAMLHGKLRRYSTWRLILSANRNTPERLSWGVACRWLRGRDATES